MNGFHFTDRGNAFNEDFAYSGALGTSDWVRERPDHDHRHAIGAFKLRRELGWGAQARRLCEGPGDQHRVVSQERGMVETR